MIAKIDHGGFRGDCERRRDDLRIESVDQVSQPGGAQLRADKRAASST